ncbi:M20/M25/M40 family metallo-hydrolase [Epilithonimonas mollis]|uniref:Leucyl aminopeptidase n=1 Tax=Epilithonimonas mollis TaxID=216903 RepID=A0A1M6NZ10_9FLAO|nr:M20/M25/M40 family metallo-hydrolase [Epilithonimonas mollis]SHK00926.1 leucyl aminopeptidase [Epilithonimonas mollis]
MKQKLLSILTLALFSQTFAQADKFYATTDAENANELKAKFPDDIEIISTNNNSAAVFLNKKAADFLHHNVITHGPGYVYKSSKEEAVSAISRTKKSNRILDFTIDQDAIVNAAIAKVSADNIKNHIQALENYGTRHHTTVKAKTAVQDLKTKWQSLITASGRTDISVRVVNHVGTTMPSLILTINGTTSPNEYIIVGAHMDSITNNVNNAPGADDDASGIATVSEMIRVLLNINYKPAKTVEFMAYAAEEIGLVGSSEIAQQYALDNKNVVSFVQFDMTNYKGSSKDVYLTTDSYNSNDLNLFLIELMEHYNKTGTHAFTYGNTICNYGCSDHFSWANNGYDAAFPFEASFSQYNPNIHTVNDKLSNMGNNATHAAKFAKLGLEFIIETAKGAFLAVSESDNNSVEIFVKDKSLNYKLGKKTVESVSIIDTSGRQLLESKNLLSFGTIDLNKINKGFYLAVFRTKSGKVITKKFVLE